MSLAWIGAPEDQPGYWDGAQKPGEDPANIAAEQEALAEQDQACICRICRWLRGEGEGPPF